MTLHKNYIGLLLAFSKRALAATLAAGLLCGFVSACSGPAYDASHWPDYLGGAHSNQFSELEQINKQNVGRLAVAWTYDFPGNGQSIGNPIVIGSRLYTVWSGGVVALNAATGKEIWRRDISPVMMRGLNIWTAKDGQSQRLFFHSNERLYALDAATGEVITAFGDGGSIDLRLGLDREPEGVRVGAQAPGRVFDNLLVLGTAGESAPGYIRAYDVITGRIVWTFHSIPHAGEPNGEGWPKDAWKTQGGVNNWAGMTLDEGSGILFVPLVGAKPNYYGVDRPGDNLYANSLVALDARTGKRLWHFQTLHHDIWDYDLPQAPKLLTLNRNGRKVSAVLVASKTGHIFVFERKTGKPVFPIEERPVPQSDVPGEQTSPTQPFPTTLPPFARQGFTLDDLDPMLDPAERDELRASLSTVRNEGLFTPPSFRGSLLSPGAWGGTNMDNGVVDPRNGRYFVVSADIPGIARLEPASDAPTGIFLDSKDGGAAIYKAKCASCHGADRKSPSPAIPSLDGLAERRDVGFVRDTIVRGRNTMPGFHLPPGDLNELLTFLGFKQSYEGAEPDKSRAAAAASAQPPAKPQAYASGPNFLFTKRGIPATKRPWSTLTAYDMNRGVILWQVPYGSLPGLKESGQIFPRGAIVGTAGGLLFAGSQDRVFRAWDMDNGKVLWEAPLPSIPGGVPAVYAVDGRQFIAAPAGQFDPQGLGASMGGMSAAGRNGLIAFALPPHGEPRHRPRAVAP